MEIRDKERHKRQWAIRWAFGLAFLGFLVPAVCQATNGLNLIGSGGISSALAGADTAVATDYTAMNTNPAGLTQISGAETGVTLGAILPSLHFRSPNTPTPNNKDGENDPIVIGSAGYVRHLTGTPVTLGVGFFTVGGLATDFRDITTPGGILDKRGSFIRHYKFTPSIGYQVTDKLSLGTALAISYADASLTFFPNTPGGFETTGTCNRANGLALPASCAYAVTFVPKFGAMYKLTDTVTLGLAYTMKAQLPFDNGRLAQNLSPLGLGRVTYDAHLQGFKWPEDLSVGIAIRPRSDLLIAAKFEWINWDAALNSVTINLTNPSTPGAPTTPINLAFNWRNQYVAAVGAAYDVNDRLNVRGGYNYGNNPVPKSALDPAFATIVEHHLVAALKYLFTQALSLEGSFTYAFKNQRTFDSSMITPFGTDLGVGNNATIQVGGIEFLFTLIYRS